MPIQSAGNESGRLRTRGGGVHSLNGVSSFLFLTAAKKSRNGRRKVKTFLLFQSFAATFSNLFSRLHAPTTAVCIRLVTILHFLTLQKAKYVMYCVCIE